MVRPGRRTRGLSFSGRSRGVTQSRFKSVRSMMYRANRGAQTWRAAMNLQSKAPEVKTIDGLAGTPHVNNLAINTTGLVTPINLITTGSGFNNRIGRKIEMQSLHITGMITQTATVTTLNDYGRLLVIYDRQTNGATPAFSDILQNYDQTSGVASGPFCGLNPDERERYVILADNRLMLPAAPANGVNGSTDPVVTTFNINRYIKLRNLNTHYKADSSPAVIGDIATGGLYIVTVGSLGAGAEGYKFRGTWRLRYKDT